MTPAVDARLVEVQRLLAHIKKVEQAALDGDPVSAEQAPILRGLFFVNLYGAIEHSLSLAVQVLLQEMSKVAVAYADFEHLIHVVALDAEFRSVAGSGYESRFTKRKALLTRQVSNDSCELNDTIFHDQLQNVWYATLREIFQHLNIQRFPLPDIKMRGYLDEIVEKRNAIAHGRSSASAVGRLTTSQELDTRLNAIREVLDHIINAFDEYLDNRLFVTAKQRTHYLPTAPVSGTSS
ncbi:MAG: MAE_28990/MAE_18760 family HEPN-like nuclease [Terriglobales bacterium]